MIEIDAERCSAAWRAVPAVGFDVTELENIGPCHCIYGRGHAGLHRCACTGAVTRVNGDDGRDVFVPRMAL